MTTTPVADRALLEAVDGLISHAVEWAGLRLRRNLPRRDRWRANRLPPGEVHVHIPVDPEQLDRHHVLDGAFDRLPAVAQRYGIDPDCLRSTLTQYVKDLLVAGQRHSFDLVPRVLRAPCLTAARTSR